jgi:hypothetical protein
MSNVTAAVGDQVPVGTVAILNSPHVSEGPGRIAKAPVPSIYVDDRGDIHRLRVGGKRINLLYSVKGVMRSGYLHPHAMHDTVISGKVEVWTLTEFGTFKTVYEQYQHFSIDPYVPHILYFLEDSVIAEWWHATDFQCWYYHPYRKIIDIQNSLNARDHPAGSTGRHQRLIPQDEANLASQKDSYAFINWGTALLAMTAASVGVFAGIAIGLAMGDTDRRRDE